MIITDYKKEFSRCLGCKLKPCERACPLQVSPHDFIALAKQDKYQEAARLIAEKNPLPQTCGLICPDIFCKKACIRGRVDAPLEIPCLQAEVMKRGGYPILEFPPSCSKKAAIIGGGAAGLGALFELLHHGWHVDLYEMNKFLGGALRLIPDYRLSKDILDFEINRLISNNRTTVFLDTLITDFSALQKQYDAVILCLGEIRLRTLGINGEECCLPYDKYLKSPRQYLGKKIAISGGGEVALDCALTAKRCGCEQVEMFVRRRREDMRITALDQQELEKFGIIVHDLSSVVEVQKKPHGLCLSTIKNRLDENGKAIPCDNTICQLDGYDFMVQALGAYYPKELIPQGFIIAGDMSGHGGMAVQALASGRAAAKKICTGDKP